MVDIQVNDGTEILSRLWDNLISRGVTNRRVDSTRIGLILSAIATELNTTVSLLESYLGQFTLQTCTDRVLVENMARLFAVPRLASKSKVVLTFYRMENFSDAVKIPANFAVQCSTDNKIVFKTIQDVYMYKGVDFVNVLATSVQSGSAYNVEANTLTTFQTNGYNTYIGVTNEEPSYGGYEDESIEELRARATGFRYERDSTIEDIQRKLMREGYSHDKWILFEDENEHGMYTICIDTDADTEFQDIQRTLGYRRMPGITQVFQRANRMYVDMYVTVYTTGDTDYTPIEKDEMFATINETIQRFFLIYCVLGADLNIKNLAAEINNALNKYKITSVDIKLDDGITLQGNILKAGQTTRLYPNKILTSLKYEGAI